MSTYKELVYMVLDELKIVSDDSHIQKEHVIFLLDKYRGLILKQTYEQQKKEIPESNYQTICVDLEHINAFNNDNCGGNGYLRSTQKVPDMMTLENPKVSTMDFFQGGISYVGRERFKYAGSSSYLKNFIYSTIAPNKYLYLKSSNPQAYHLKKVKITGIFEDSSKAAELACPDDSSEEQSCDVMDKAFPLEEGLISQVIQLVVKELSGVLYRPKDSINDAFDNLSSLYSWMAKNIKSQALKDLEN